MKKIVFLLSGFLLVSCTSSTIYKKPDNLIPRDTMVSLLSDLYIASFAFHEKNIQLEKKVNYMPFVYEKYKIDSTRFKESNFYYLTKVDEYDILSKEVKDNLKKRKEALERLVKNQKDSTIQRNLKGFQNQ